MRIAFVTHAFPRLHNTFILNEIVELIRRGHFVKVYSMQRTKEKLFNKDLIDYNLVENAAFFDEHKTKSPPEFEKYSACIRNAVDSLESIAQLIRNDKIDIIHGIFGNRPATAAMLLSRMTGIPFTFESHAYDLFVDFKFAEEKTLEASLIFTESNYNLNYLKEFSDSVDAKTKVIHLAPNLKMLEQIPELPRMDHLIVSACRMHPIKGLEYGLVAFAKLLQKYPDLNYVIIGSGTEPIELGQKAGLEQIVNQLSIQNSVAFLGDITNEKVAEIVAQAAIFLLPCVIADNGDRDGTPTAIAEAMFLRTPVVSTNISGIPELVDHNENGILVDQQQVDQLAEAIDELISNPEKRRAFGDSGREKIYRDFNIEKSCAEMVNLWEQALE